MKLNLNAACNGQNEFENFAYFFKDDMYIKYDWINDIPVEGYPQPISSWNLPSSFNSGIDAVFNGSGSSLGKAYFFKGREYVRYDWANNSVDEGYPLSLDAWNLPGDFANGIDAAIEGVGGSEGKVYFFKNNQYVRYDLELDQVDEGYPLDINEWSLEGTFLLGVDTAINGKGEYAGKTYFFKGNNYIRFDWESNQSEDGLQDIGVWNLNFINNNNSGFKNTLQNVADKALLMVRKPLTEAKSKILSEERIADNVEWCGFTQANIYKQAGADPKITSTYFAHTQRLLYYGSYYTIDYDQVNGNLLRHQNPIKKPEIKDGSAFVNLKEYHSKRGALRKVILFDEISQNTPLDILPGDIVLLDHSGKNGPDHIQVVYKWIESERILIVIDGNGGGFTFPTSTSSRVEINPNEKSADKIFLKDKLAILQRVLEESFVYPGRGAGRVGISCHKLLPENQVTFAQTGGEHSRIWAIIRPSEVDFEAHEYRNL